MTSRVTVVVPSWRRPVALGRCLSGLSVQTRPADEIVVVRRDDDLPTSQAIARAPLEVIESIVTRPGVAAALVTGTLRASGDIIAFTDDDAVPRSTWVDQLLAHFADASVGAVGGRDHIHDDDAALKRLTEDVGRLSSWGRFIGNHSLGTGPPRRVSVLKGVNMAFRREALALPLDYQGPGTQPDWEVAACLWAGARGWGVVYDPAIVVDHYPGSRVEGDLRERRDAEAVRAAAYNLVAGILLSRPELLWRRALFGLVLGQSEVPGLLRAALALPRREWQVLRALPNSLRGQACALVAGARGRRLAMVHFASPSTVTSPACPTHVPPHSRAAERDERAL